MEKGGKVLCAVHAYEENFLTHSHKISLALRLLTWPTSGNPEAGPVEGYALGLL